MAEKKTDFKYKVIGWTSCYSQIFPDDRNCCKEKYRALIEHIRAEGLVFGGDVHEDYCPVFNDGTKLSFSWRGWGGVMAEAWNPDDKDPYKYSLYYMDELINPAVKKRPQKGADEKDIENKIWREVICTDEQFWELHGFLGKVILCPFAPELDKIEKGDFVRFKNSEIEELEYCMRADGVFRAESIEELLKILYDDFENSWDDLSECLGYERELPLETLAIKLKEKYPGNYKNGFWTMHFHSVD